MATKRCPAPSGQDPLERKLFKAGTLIVSGTLGCFACGADSSDTAACAGQAIVGGTRDLTTPASLGTDDGIGYVWIIDSSAGKRSERFCTVTRTRVGKAVSARHCFEGASNWEAWVGFGATALPAPRPCEVVGPQLFRVAAHHPSQTCDIDVFDFDDPGGRILRVASADPALNAPVVLAGYGVTEDGSMGEKRFAPSTVVAADEHTLTVGSNGKSGSCVGDSGGPLLIEDEAGQYRLSGVLSAGSLSCKGKDVYTSVNAVSEWLRECGAL